MKRGIIAFVFVFLGAVGFSQDQRCELSFDGVASYEGFFDTQFVVYSPSGDTVSVLYLWPDGRRRGFGVIGGFPVVVNAGRFGDFHGTIKVSSDGMIVVSVAVVVGARGALYGTRDSSPGPICSPGDSTQ